MFSLITGSSGFVGQNLVPYLRKADIVTHCISRNELENITERFLHNCDAIVHLAGKAHDLKKSAQPEEYYQVNFELTKRLYDEFLRSGAKKFIFISSVKASADRVDGILYEDSIPNPQTDYGKSKLMAENYIQSQTLPEGKSYYILRPCMIHGPGNKGNLNLLYKFVEKGIPYPLAAFHNQRSFLSIENLCFVIKVILKQNISSGIYQVADDEALSTNKVVSLLAESLNKKPILWAISSNMIKFLATIGDKFKLPLNSERLQKLTENYIVSNVKLKNALKADLPEKATTGILKTANSFK